MAIPTASPKNYIKNLGPQGTFSTLGNNGLLFPWDQPEIPGAFGFSCSLSIEENREVSILTQDGQTIYINCPLGF